MRNLKQHCSDFLLSQSFDALAMGVVDFEKNESQSFVLGAEESVFFDLASLSKPLTISLGAFSSPERIDGKMELLMNHRAGLPSWGILPKVGWQDIILSYPIKESETLYSDYSALRFMLEFNKKGAISLHEMAARTWDEEVVFWKNLQESAVTLQNGYEKGRPNFRKVHDPNARVIDDYVSHAGLFGTVKGVCKTLLNFDRSFSLLQKMNDELQKPHERFVLGWDTVSNTEDTLAGNHCGERVFGHLGFTGTSIWIDPVKKLGYTLLSNATKEHWHAKSELNQFRKSLGEFIWQNSLF